MDVLLEYWALSVLIWLFYLSRILPYDSSYMLLLMFCTQERKYSKE